MTRLDDTTRHYCEQQAQRAGAVFLLARQFLPGERAERAVVITAFIETIEAVAADVSDPGVAATKFEWWRQALSGASDAGERHPLIGALAAHGELSGDRATRLQAHVGAVASMMDPQPATTADDLFERLSAPGAVRSLVAAGAESDLVPAETLALHGAVSLVLRHLAASMPDLGPRQWWVPMDWRARLAGEADEREGQAEALLVQTVGLLKTWQERADGVLVEVARKGRPGAGLLDFLALESGLRLRWLRHVGARPAEYLSGGDSALGWRDAVFAWRRARRVVSRNGGQDR